MKTTAFSTSQPAGHPLSTSPADLNIRQSLSTEQRPLPQLVPSGNPPGSAIRHILLGDRDAIRQTIHLLHTLRYAETLLWSPILTINEPLLIAPAQGKAISLLRRPL